MWKTVDASMKVIADMKSALTASIKDLQITSKIWKIESKMSFGIFCSAQEQVSTSGSTNKCHNNKLTTGCSGKLKTHTTIKYQRLTQFDIVLY